MPRKKRITKKVLFTKSVEILQPIMQLNDWKLVVTFTNSQRMKNLADCEASPEYKFAKIRVKLEHLKDLSHNEIVSTAVHEMTHCLLWNLGTWAGILSKKDAHKYEITRQYEESTVTTLEKIFIPLIADILNEELRMQGYSNVDLTFTDFAVNSE